MEATSASRKLVEDVLGNLRARYEALDLIGIGSAGAEVVTSSASAAPFPSVQPSVVHSALHPTHRTAVTGATQIHIPTAAAAAGAASGAASGSRVLSAHAPRAAAEAKGAGSADAGQPTPHRHAKALTLLPTQEQQLRRIEVEAEQKRHAAEAARAHKYAPLTLPPQAAAKDRCSAAQLPREEAPAPAPPRSLPPRSLRAQPIDDPAFHPSQAAADVERRALVDEVMRDMGYVVAPPPAADDDDDESNAAADATRARIANYLLANAAIAQSPIPAAADCTQLSHPSPAAPRGDAGEQREAPERRGAVDERPAAAEEAPERSASGATARHVDPNWEEEGRAPTPAAPSAAPTEALRTASEPVAVRPITELGGDAMKPPGGARGGGAFEVLAPTFTASEIDDMLSKRSVQLDGRQRDTLLRAAERAFGGIVGATDATSRVHRLYPNIVLRKHAMPSVSAVMSRIAQHADALTRQKGRPATDVAAKRHPVRTASASGPRESKSRPASVCAAVEEPRRAHRFVAHTSAARRVEIARAPLQPSLQRPFHPLHGTGKARVEWRASSAAPRKPKTLFGAT